MAAELMEFSGINKSMFIQNILDAGCGTGCLTEHLIRLFPQSYITGVDIAEGMIDFVKGKLQGTKLDFICDDIENMDHPGNYDLIASNAVFQWLNDLPATLDRLSRCINPHGILCFSTFGENTFIELHRSYEQAHRKLGLNKKVRPGQGFYCRRDIENILKYIFAKDYDMWSREKLEYTYFDTVMDFFKSVRKIGANNSNRGYIHRNPSLIRETIRIYESEYSIENKIRVTYQCMYFVVKRSA